MAGNAVVGALRVVLGADTAAFENGMKQAQARLSKFSSSVGKAAASIAATMAAIGTATALAIRGVLNEADKLSKLSQSIGVPIEQLSALKYAAEQSGASIDELGRLFRNVARNMQAAAASPNEFSRALASIGVAWRDAEGNFRRADQLMLDVAEKFANMKDGAGKTALAMKIFGEEMGPKLLPMLNQGRDGINSMMLEAAQLGLVIDKEAGAAAERFNDDLSRLGNMIRGFVVQLTSRLAPVLATVVEKFKDLIIEGRNVENIMTALEFSFKSLVTVVITVAASVSAVVEWLKTLWNVASAIANRDWSGAWESFTNGLTDIKTTAVEAFQAVRDVWLEAAKLDETLKGGEDNSAQEDPPLVQNTRALAAAAREHNMALREGQAIIDSLKSPYELMMDMQTRLSELFQQGAIDARTFGLAMQRSAFVAADSYLGLANTAMGALSKLFGQSKLVAIATAIVNTAQAVTRTLAQYGATPWGLAAAAVAAAAGAAEIATIRSTNIGSRSGGGSVPSASGAVGSSAQQQTFSQTLHVQGFSPGQLFTGDAMRELISELLQRQRDGAQVVLL